MTCQTGIRADSQLLEFFDQCKQCKVRFGKIVINSERLCVNHRLGPSKDWRKDWKKCLPECLDAYEPCFLLFRFDSGHDWILISFADDKASVRDKMLLAATKATFKSEFGQSFIRAEYQIASRNDLQLDDFEKRMSNQNAGETAIEDNDDSQPLSFVERELSSVAKERASIPFSMHASQTLRGVQFPIDQDAEEWLRTFASGNTDFVQLSVDCLNEAIKLEAHRVSLDPADLDKLMPRQKPRYSLLRLRNSLLSGQQANFFIYSVPPSQSCSIKELMLFSSCKGPLLTELQGPLGIQIDKKIEMDSRDPLDQPTLLAYVTPEQQQQAENQPNGGQVQQFERPPRPGGGPRRITKVVP